MTLFDSIHTLFESGEPIVNEFSANSERSVFDCRQTTKVVDLLEEDYDSFVKIMTPLVNQVMAHSNATALQDISRDEQLWMALYDYLSIHTDKDVEQVIDNFINRTGKHFFTFKDNLEESDRLYGNLSDEDRRVALINSTLSDESDAVNKWQALIDSNLFTDDEVEHIKQDQQEEREHIETLKQLLNKRGELELKEYETSGQDFSDLYDLIQYLTDYLAVNGQFENSLNSSINSAVFDCLSKLTDVKEQIEK